jgi:hypothetical protein
MRCWANTTSKFFETKNIDRKAVTRSLSTEMETADSIIHQHHFTKT